MVPVPVPTFEKITVPVPVPAPYLDHKKIQRANQYGIGLDPVLTLTSLKVEFLHENIPVCCGTVTIYYGSGSGSDF